MSEWIQANKDFIEKFKEWKLLSVEQKEELRRDVPSLYATSAPTPSTVIMKNQMKGQSRLTPIGNEQKKTWRLSGDFFDYISKLEKANYELQNQLDTAVLNMKESQIEHLRELNSSRSMQDSLANQMSTLADRFRKAETEHLAQLNELGNTVEELRNEIANLRYIESSLRNEIQVLKDKSLISTNEEEASKKLVTEESRSEDLEKCIRDLKEANEKLAFKSEAAERLLQEQDKELCAVWERVHELHHQLKDSIETEKAFEEQSIAIEHLRTKLETTFNLAPNSEKTLQSSTSLEILETLPPPDSRLMRTPEGWEWTPWIQRTTTKAFERDLQGLKRELEDLTAHRSQAFLRARNRGVDIVLQVASYVPFASVFIGQKK